MWKLWANCRTFLPLFTTLVLLPIYFVYSSVSIYRTFTRFIGQCPAWLAVSTPLHITLQLFILLRAVWIPPSLCFTLYYVLMIQAVVVYYSCFHCLRSILLMLFWNWLLLHSWCNLPNHVYRKTISIRSMRMWMSFPFQKLICKITKIK